jgi:hypothetical protein
MPLDSRKVAHVLANRAKIEAGRSETVTVYSTSAGVDGYGTAAVQWFDAGRVPAGIANRIGEVTRQPYDALAIFAHGYAFPDGLRAIARTPTATQAGVAAATAAGLLFTVLDRRRIGLGTRGDYITANANVGDRWIVRLRQRRN